MKVMRAGDDQIWKLSEEWEVGKTHCRPKDLIKSKPYQSGIKKVQRKRITY